MYQSMEPIKRKWTIVSLILIVPIGFLTKFYAGPLADWVNNSLGGVFYVIFWSLLFFLLIPKAGVFKISALVFVCTCCLEFLQLWHPTFLELIRSNFFGRTLLGTTFSRTDFIYYFIGFLISLLLLKYISGLEQVPDN